MQPLKLIKINSSGPLVESWQFFLRGLGLFNEEINGEFGPETKEASILFQKKNNLEPDGVVGNKSFGAAMQLGFEGIVDERTDKTGADFPGKPAFPSLVSNAQRQQVFGSFSFVSQPVPGNAENIRITDNWESLNIATFSVPQLIAVKGSPNVRFHKKAGDQLVKLFSDWEDAGLHTRIITWGGSFVPRFIRGSRSVLSNHAFGSAFDVNMAWNSLGVIPALLGQKGCVRELVEIANDNGFYWGGHFSRKDGMHFEIAEIM
ncbi:MAG: Peptidoglycan-binding domain 1 protein [Ferruginibacter sp.]|nr:Peptidoglycan-binding domain 1 protein [Ferruginibacter sp.]